MANSARNSSEMSETWTASAAEHTLTRNTVLFGFPIRFDAGSACFLDCTSTTDCRRINAHNARGPVALEQLDRSRPDRHPYTEGFA